MKTTKRALPNELLSFEREQRHWTQEYVAEQIGAPDTKMVGKWERGITVPAPHYRQQLEALFGKNARELGIVRNHDIPFWRVPYRQNLFFTGRESVLMQLHNTLTTARTAAVVPPQALSGLSGVGKTQTALEYAYRYGHEYQIVVWIQAYSREVLEADFAALAALFNLPEKQEQDQKKAIQAVKRWLASLTRWLLIFDNADELSLLDDFLPSPARGHILLTTRTQATGTMAQAIEIEAMPPEEGALFLLRRAKLITLETPRTDITEEDFRLAVAITQALGGLPLALDQAGAYIEESSCGLAHYLTLYQKHREVFLQRRGEIISNHPEPVATTWSLAFEKIQRVNPTAIKVLHFLAFLAPYAIPQEIVTAGATEPGLLSASLLSEPMQFEMPYRVLCNGMQRAGVKVSPDLALVFSVIHRYTKLGMASSLTPS